MRALAAAGGPAHGHFCGQRPHGGGRLQAAHELGLPEALSVVGFDDTRAAGAYPALTTVARACREMGRAAMRLLAAQLGGEKPTAPTTQIEAPTRLIIRQSTAPPRTAERS